MTHYFTRTNQGKRTDQDKHPTCQLCPTSLRASALELLRSNFRALRRLAMAKSRVSIGSGVRVIVSIVTLATTLQWLSFPVSAQEGNRDYYAPRTNAAEKELLMNVEKYHLNQGREKTQNGQYESALGEWMFMLRYYPNHPLALAGLSELCTKWKSPACASAEEQAYKRAISRNPNVSQSYVLEAMRLHRDKKLDAAVKFYKSAIDISPDSVNAHYNLGLAYTDLKQYDLANQHAQKAYGLGVTLPGLRIRLEKVSKWNPHDTLPVTDPNSSGTK